jgi:hypothetical protein
MGQLIIPTSSGSYIPNVTNETGACSSSIFTSAYFSQIGNIVNVSIYGSTVVDFSTNTQGTIEFDFPFNQTTPNAIGTLSIDKAFLIQGYVYNNFIAFSSNDISIVGQALQFTVTFQYKIN